MKYFSDSPSAKSAPRALVLLPFLIAAPALVLVASRLHKYAPSTLLIGVALVGLVVGVCAWWVQSGPPPRTLVDVSAVDRIGASARSAIEQLNAKTRGKLSAREVDELWVFYERWINLDPDMRSRFREELASEGINMIRLGDALRFLTDG